jgi:hypothetical protein
MKAKWLGGASAIVTVGVLLVSACSGSDASTGGGQDEGGPPADVPEASVPTPPPPPAGDCTVDADCTAKLPTTTPADCAVATCDTLQRKCLFKAKDADGDGHLAKNCSAATVTVEAGDDCDDTDPSSYPGAWDGPATDFDSGPGVQQDRCDQKDNDCDGSPDNGKLAVDGGDKTCKCDPNKPLPCYEYPNGVPISASTLDGSNNPKGMCKKGVRSCVGGIPGACNGAVGPEQEICDDQDHDCDGVSGNAGDVKASGRQSFCPDADSDNYCVTGSCVTACVAPTKSRPQNTCLGTDCNDAVGTTHPGATEYCGDGVDSNCAGGDSDGYGNLGTACTAGTFGICKRKGTYVCSGDKLSTTCNATAGAATGAASSPSADPLIDLTQNRTGYDARWDYNCNNTMELAESLYGGSFNAYACAGSPNYQEACQQLGTAAACNAGVFGAKFFTCAAGGFDLTPSLICGKQANYIGCNWQYSTSGCDYIPNTFTPNNHAISCQ